VSGLAEARESSTGEYLWLSSNDHHSKAWRKSVEHCLGYSHPHFANDNDPISLLRGIVSNNIYDNAGRMLTRTFPAVTAENITYVWDLIASGNKGKGRITSATDQSGSTAWVYDSRGNVTSETRVVQGKSYITNYVYNAADLVTQITYPSGRIVIVARNSLGKISGITTKKDAAAAAVNVATGITWSEMAELVKGFTYCNGLTFAATYDLDYRIATLKVKNGATDTISFAYSYADGPNLQANDGINLTRIADTLTAGNSVDLWYSGLGRLQNANGPWGTLTYAYNATGNRTHETKVTGGNTTAQVLNYPTTNNRISSETINGAAARSFTYDGAGNMLTGLPAGAAYALDYSKRNRPSALKQSGTVVTSYLYNAMEQLASRAVSSPLTPVGTTHYIYDLDGNLIAEAFGATAATAVLVREYIWLEGMPVMAIDGVNTATPVLYAVHTDHLTRPIRLTNSTKAQVWNAQWLPWGGAHAVTGTVAQSLRFPGQYFLIEQGLSYNWHRMYDQTTGRYTQPDPLGFTDGPAIYTYAGNNPLMFVDPSGLKMPYCELPSNKRLPSCAGNLPVGGGGSGGTYRGGAYTTAGSLIGIGITAIFNACMELVGGGGGSGDPPRSNRPGSGDDEPVGDAMRRCRKAANGTPRNWTDFCTASRWFAPVDGTRSARCHSKSHASRTEKLNFCFNEFGR
jgi:RHS repeat-associated protein